MTLNGIHHEAIALSLAGKHQGEIATELKRGIRTVARWFADDDFLAALEKQGRREFAALAGEAKEQVYLLMLNAEPHSVRLRAAQLILDYGGYKPVEHSEVALGGKGGGDITVTLKMAEA